MLFNDAELKEIENIVGAYCRNRVPKHLKDKLKVWYETKGFDVKIFESKPHAIEKNAWTKNPVARLRYNPRAMEWDLSSAKSPGVWQRYSSLNSAKNLLSLMDEIHKDTHRVFWK